MINEQMKFMSRALYIFDIVGAVSLALHAVGMAKNFMTNSIYI